MLAPIFAKTWIYWTSAVFFGSLGLFSLIFGPLFLMGVITPAHGGSGHGSGIAMTIGGVVFLLVFALAVFNIAARNKPLIAFFHDGMEINIIGASALDEVPLVPGIIRVAWAILSGQGFRTQQIWIPRNCVVDVLVYGLPMAKLLVIQFAYYDGHVRIMRQVAFPEVVFADSIDSVAAAVHDYCHSDGWA